jgi:hypothetical protein
MAGTQHFLLSFIAERARINLFDHLKAKEHQPEQKELDLMRSFMSV